VRREPDQGRPAKGDALPVFWAQDAFAARIRRCSTPGAAKRLLNVVITNHRHHPGMPPGGDRIASIASIM
jgi:hypothetical protein